MMQSENIAEIAAALAKAQAAIKSPPRNRTVTVKTKDGRSYTFDYTTLDELIEAVRRPLTDNGLWFVQTLANGDGRYRLRTMLVHSSGQWIASETPILAGSNSNQEFGSALTYMKRYSLAALLGVASDEDDDGNAAEGNERIAQARGQASGPKAAPAAKAPPADPLPDLSKAALVPVPTTADGQSADWLGWGGKIVPILKACKTLEQATAWLTANDAPLKNLRASGPEKVAKRVDAVIEEVLAALSQAPQEAA